MDPLDRYEMDEAMRLRRYVPQQAGWTAWEIVRVSLVLLLSVIAGAVVLGLPS